MTGVYVWLSIALDNLATEDDFATLHVVSTMVLISTNPKTLTLIDVICVYNGMTGE